MKNKTLLIVLVLLFVVVASLIVFVVLRNTDRYDESVIEPAEAVRRADEAGRKAGDAAKVAELSRLRSAITIETVSEGVIPIHASNTEAGCIPFEGNVGINKQGQGTSDSFGIPLGDNSVEINKPLYSIGQRVSIIDYTIGYEYCVDNQSEPTQWMVAIPFDDPRGRVGSLTGVRAGKNCGEKDGYLCMGSWSTI